jgi:hypothetical protein
MLLQAKHYTTWRRFLQTAGSALAATRLYSQLHRKVKIKDIKRTVARGTWDSNLITVERDAEYARNSGR